MSERMPLATEDPNRERTERLRRDFPEAFTEGKIDFEKLRAALGEDVSGERERYGLSWAGKSGAIRNIQTPSVATLVPQRGESVAFDETENLFIEGDNLEVLKLLQKSYYGRVKMIYIDPPYNTGNEFIYPDNFREGIDDYLRYSGQTDEEGVKLATNTETGGRYHSKWLNMMYPRLFLARNLLREDGVIFISIDDHEVHNLLLMMNEIFGEENFVASVLWQKRYSPSNDTVDFSASHDFILVYAKTRNYAENGKIEAILSKLERTAEQNKVYKNPDNDERGLWRPDNYTCNKSASERPNLYYPVVQPNTGEEIWPNKSAVWRYSRDKHAQYEKENRIWWGKNGTNRVPSYKRFLSDVGGVIANTWWTWEEAGHNDESKKEIRKLLPDVERAFDTPKPTRLIRRMLQLSTKRERERERERDGTGHHPRLLRRERNDGACGHGDEPGGRRRPQVHHGAATGEDGQPGLPDHRGHRAGAGQAGDHEPQLPRRRPTPRRRRTGAGQGFPGVPAHVEQLRHLGRRSRKRRGR